MTTLTGPEFKWWAQALDSDGHAFPQREDVGFPPPALCGVRWTVAFRFRQAGGHYCDECQTILRRVVDGAQAALDEVLFWTNTSDLEALSYLDSPAGAGEMVEAFRG